METVVILQGWTGKSYKDVVDSLTTEEDHGDCCGYAECNETIPELPEGVTLDDLVLDHVVKIEYGDEGNYSGDRTVVNFMFKTPSGDIVILGQELRADSGSGWSYGAYVRLFADEEEIAEASW